MCEAQPIFIIKKQKNTSKKAEVCYYATTLRGGAALCIDSGHLIFFLLIHFWACLFLSLLPERQRQPDVTVASSLGVRAAHLADQRRRIKAAGLKRHRAAIRVGGRQASIAVRAEGAALPLAEHSSGTH